MSFAVRLLSRVLKNVHAGEAKLLWHRPAVANAPIFEISSPAFDRGGTIPLRYAGHGVGEDVEPPLAWKSPPAGTAAFVLVVEDADAPTPKPIVHAILTGLSAAIVSLGEGQWATSSMDAAFGTNTLGKRGYSGPRPLPGHGPHAYTFQLLALNKKVSFPVPPRLSAVVAAIDGSVIGRARIDGVLEQP